jgi:hypothetical protein
MTSTRLPRDPDLLRSGLIKIGKCLADSDFRIMVYTADLSLDYAAQYVVEGFRASRKRKMDDTIIVRRAAVDSKDRFPEEDNDPRYHLDVRAEESWDVRFYLSMFEIDGIIVVGNGNFTYFGGLHAVGSGKPLLALGGFGGVADGILKLVRNKVSDKAYSCMAQTSDDVEWAKAGVAALREQIEDDRRLEQETRERKELKQARLGAVFSTAIIVVLLVALAQSLRSDPDSLARAYATAFLPACAGLVGGIQRIVFGYLRGETLPSHRRSFWICGALGFSAGGILGALYTLTQVKMAHVGVDSVSFSVLSLWAITFGYGIGFSLDKAFNKLIRIDETVTEAAKQRDPNKGTRRQLRS